MTKREKSKKKFYCSNYIIFLHCYFSFSYDKPYFYFISHKIVKANANAKSNSFSLIKLLLFEQNSRKLRFTKDVVLRLHHKLFCFYLSCTSFFFLKRIVQISFYFVNIFRIVFFRIKFRPEPKISQS